MTSEDPGEQWQPRDLVIDAESWLFVRASEASVEAGLPWAYAEEGPYNDPDWAPEGTMGESSLVRPLTLLARDGQPVVGSS